MKRVALLIGLVGCTTQVPVRHGVASFQVELVSIDPFTKSPACDTAPDSGTAACPRPFPEESAPVHVLLRVRALDETGLFLPSYDGTALIDARPGRVSNVGPAGQVVQLASGVAETEVQLVHAFGATRLWVEDCGSSTSAGTFASGVSPEIWFDNPRIDQINFTDDNTLSPLVPRPTNVCAISGDPRFGIGVDNNGEVGFVGYSHGRTVNAPPPAMGNFIEITGCSRAELAAHTDKGEACPHGPLVVTGIGNEGFFVTDMNPVAMARGFNHLYAFNFNYPDDLEVGDFILSLRGSPVEFTGSTQIGNPSWVKDPSAPGATPSPVKLDPTVYRSALRTEVCTSMSFGGNARTALDLEKLEGALVCVDHLAPASHVSYCDKNSTGGIERGGCPLDCDAPPPPRCSEGVGLAPTGPLCDDASLTPMCLALSEQELTDCHLSGWAPANAPEYCCERACYQDPECTEGSSYESFGQWSADIFGNYDATSSGPVKISLLTRDANPDFDPLKFAQLERQKPAGERKTVKVVGNLRQVLAARPVWVVIARGPSDIEVGGSCP